MIDYSVYLQHNPMDETAPPKAYAKAQMRELMDTAMFINHLSNHNGGFSRGAISGVLSDTCTCVVEQLLEGKKVQLGELGFFWISLSCKGADSMEEFTVANIDGVNIIFTPGPDFENLIDKAKFNPVASRVAQAATLKVEKAGGETVDLAAAKAAAKPNSGTSENTNQGTNTGENTGGNTGGNTGENTGGNTGGGNDSGSGDDDERPGVGG